MFIEHSGAQRDVGETAPTQSVVGSTLIAPSRCAICVPSLGAEPVAGQGWQGVQPKSGGGPSPPTIFSPTL